MLWSVLSIFVVTVWIVAKVAADVVRASNNNTRAELGAANQAEADFDPAKYRPLQWMK